MGNPVEIPPHEEIRCTSQFVRRYTHVWTRQAANAHENLTTTQTNTLVRTWWWQGCKPLKSSPHVAGTPASYFCVGRGSHGRVGIIVLLVDTSARAATADCTDCSGFLMEYIGQVIQPNTTSHYGRQVGQ